jgi:glycosyltransferase involved in cell wall biosynthesis
MISEGSYPVCRGGLSEWAHELIRELSFIEFDVFCIAPPRRTKSLYDRLPNLKNVVVVEVSNTARSRKSSSLPKSVSAELADCLVDVLYGRHLNCERLAEIVKKYHVKKTWLQSREVWDTVVAFYEKNCPERDFREFFWTALGIYSMLLDGLALVDRVPVADVYHSLTAGLGGVIGSVAKVLHGKPLIVSELGQYMRERTIELARYKIPETAQRQIIRLSETMLRTSYKYADLIVPVSSSYIPPELELGAELRKIRIVSNGIDSQRFVPNLSRNGAGPVVGCFARVVPVKGQLTFIKACKKVLENCRASFVIVGEVRDDPKYYEQCKALVDELGLTEDVKFVGYADNLLEWYHKVDVFVLPSLWEGIPLALLEAMSCGLPCVCTGVGGVPDIIRDASVGYIVPPEDPDGMSAKIIQLLEDETLRKEMGKRARQLIEEKYTVEHMAEGILRTYLEVLLDGSSQHQS